MIKGIYAEDADKLNPEQWVNVYYLMLSDKAIFHSSCQVKELNLDNKPTWVFNPLSRRQIFFFR